jgi:hypothetical protein
MVIDQRNAGASVTPTDGTYTLDRWLYKATQASKTSVQQNAGAVTPPTGFTNYLGCTSLSAYAVLTGDAFNIQQRVEGFNTADLAWGTANAQTITLSFWVRSSLTGTFGGSVQNSAGNRSYPFSYTISVANTWEQKTVVVSGDTSGTWVTNNGIGAIVMLSLGAGTTFSGTAGAWAASDLRSATGATSVVGTNTATFYITGVQLEKGSTATSFDYRPYGTELALCQRYAWTIKGSSQQVCNGFVRLAALFTGTIQFPVTMRTNAALTVPNSAGYFNVSWGSSDTSMATIAIGGAGTLITENNALLQATLSGATVGQGGVLQLNNASSYVLFTAEL